MSALVIYKQRKEYNTKCPYRDQVKTKLKHKLKFSVLCFRVNDALRAVKAPAPVHTDYAKLKRQTVSTHNPARVLSKCVNPYIPHKPLDRDQINNLQLCK